MTVPSEQHDPITRSPRTRNVGAIIAVVVLLLCAGISSLIGMLLPMGSDPCHEGDPQLICTVTGQTLAMALPVGGAGLGLIVALIGLRARVRRPLRWIAAGYLITFAGFLAGWLIASNGP
jgi:hypothetical protein